MSHQDCVAKTIGKQCDNCLFCSYGTCCAKCARGPKCCTCLDPDHCRGNYG